MEKTEGGPNAEFKMFNRFFFKLGRFRFSYKATIPAGLPLPLDQFPCTGYWSLKCWTDDPGSCSKKVEVDLFDKFRTHL